MEKPVNPVKNKFGNQRGAILAMVAIFFVIFVGLLALAIDVNHLYVVRNELQNAADSGALAGAQALYADLDGAGGLEAGEIINVGANEIAQLAGLENTSDNTPVEITTNLAELCPSPDPSDLSDDPVDVRRGHWSFQNNKFTCIEDTTEPIEIRGVPDDDLDQMDGSYQYPPGSGQYPKNVNAVRVVAHREDIEADSFFAKIYGFFGFQMQAEAVAYIGFSGSLGPLEADMPILICDTSLSNGDCNIGRMINSAKSPSDSGSTSNTAAWSDMDPEADTSQCKNGANNSEVKPLISKGCDCFTATPGTECGVNEEEIRGNDWLGANNGMLQNVYDDMKGCYETYTSKESPWEMTLPVVSCDDGPIENCTRVVGAVSVNMLYMSDSNPTPDETPIQMTIPGPDPDTDDDFEWVASRDCGFFYDLANRVDADGNADNLLTDVLPLLPEKFVDEVTIVDGVTIVTPVKIVDPWLIDERWKAVSPVDVYDQDKAKWDCFVDHHNLINSDGNMAPLAFKSMYFMPSCEFQEPKGTTNGPNFGIRAKYPVLVD